MRVRAWYSMVLVLVFSLSWGTKVQAKNLLADLDLSKGNWEMVGVKLYNYKMTPIQEELGTFVLQNPNALKKMQAKWDFAPCFEDYCDYHYALKFYRNKQLVKTLKVNLVCGYITEGLLSYKFDPALFTEHKSHYGRLPWSRIHFSDMERLRTALKKLQATPEVYMYQDVKPFAYDGYFVLGIDGLKWSVNRDSIMKVVGQKVEKLTGSNNFYIEPLLFFMNEKFELSFRFNIYCDEKFANKYIKGDPKNVTAEWRSHFEYLDDDDKTIMLVVIGVNQEKYNRIVN